MLLFSTFLNLAVFCQSIPLGNYISHEIADDRVIITAENGFLRIKTYAEDIIRVTISKDKDFDDFSYAVIRQPENTGIEITNGDELLTITTSKIRVSISTLPLRISFFDNKGNLLEKDEETIGTRFSGTETYIYKSVMKNQKIIGLGEKTGPFNKAGRSYTFWNTDFPSYGIYDDPLYASTPFYLGIHGTNLYGIFMDNMYRSVFSLGKAEEKPTYLVSTNGDFDYYFFGAQTMSGIIEDYTWLTGRMELPPKWSLGVHQSRWSYYPDDEVLNVARTYREKQIPADVMTLDIHYMDDYKLFTWHPDRFPQPADMISQLSGMGFKTTVILDPGIKVEQGYHAYESGLKDKIFVKNPGGKSYFTGQVWPGWCHFPDFTNPDGRTWWQDQIKSLATDRILGYWNDMNEPALWSKDFPGIAEHDFEGMGGTHLKAHNVYGMQMARASYEGAVKHLNGKRPFVLTRAAFSGVQRYSAVWTGDNVASDTHMMLGIRMLNSMGLAGMPFVGMDVAGFSGGATNELFARWTSIAAFSPFFRFHSAKNTKAGEPWNYAEWVEDAAKEYIETRYRLIPYIYSVFYEASKTGMPVQRTLAISHPFDTKVYDQRFENQYFFGPSMMVAPVASDHQYVKTYLPSDGFYDFYDDTFYPEAGEYVVDAHNGRQGTRLPVFIKAGSIIPMQSVVQNLSEKPSDTLELHVYYGTEKNEFEFYDDDGETFDYREGLFYKRNIIFDPLKKEIKLTRVEGNFTSPFKVIRIYLHGFPPELKYILNGKKTSPIEEMYGRKVFVTGKSLESIQLNWK